MLHLTQDRPAHLETCACKGRAPVVAMGWGSLAGVTCRPGWGSLAGATCRSDWVSWAGVTCRSGWARVVVTCRSGWETAAAKACRPCLAGA